MLEAARLRLEGGKIAVVSRKPWSYYSTNRVSSCSMDRRSVDKQMLQETRITPNKVDLLKTIQNMELAQNLAFCSVATHESYKEECKKMYFLPIFSTLLTHYTHTYAQLFNLDVHLFYSFLLTIGSLHSVSESNLVF